MKKNIIALSVVAALSTTTSASDINKEMYNQIQALKAQIEALEKKMAEQEKQQTKTPVITVDEKRIEKSCVVRKKSWFYYYSGPSLYQRKRLGKIGHRNCSR